MADYQEPILRQREKTQVLLGFNTYFVCHLCSTSQRIESNFGPTRWYSCWEITEERSFNLIQKQFFCIKLSKLCINVCLLFTCALSNLKKGTEFRIKKESLREILFLLSYSFHLGHLLVECEHKWEIPKLCYVHAFAWHPTFTYQTLWAKSLANRYMQERKQAERYSLLFRAFKNERWACIYNSGWHLLVLLKLHVKLARKKFCVYQSKHSDEVKHIKKYIQWSER